MDLPIRHSAQRSTGSASACWRFPRRAGHPPLPAELLSEQARDGRSAAAVLSGYCNNTNAVFQTQIHTQGEHVLYLCDVRHRQRVDDLFAMLRRLSGSGSRRRLTNRRKKRSNTQIRFRSPLPRCESKRRAPSLQIQDAGTGPRHPAENLGMDGRRKIRHRSRLREHQSHGSVGLHRKRAGPFRALPSARIAFGLRWGGA